MLNVIYISLRYHFVDPRQPFWIADFRCPHGNAWRRRGEALITENANFVVKEATVSMILRVKQETLELVVADQARFARLIVRDMSSGGAAFCPRDVLVVMSARSGQADSYSLCLSGLLALTQGAQAHDVLPAPVNVEVRPRYETDKYLF